MNKYHTIEFKEVVKAPHTAYCIRFAIVDDPDPTQSDRRLCNHYVPATHAAKINNMRPLNPEGFLLELLGPKCDIHPSVPFSPRIVVLEEWIEQKQRCLLCDIRKTGSFRCLDS